MKITHTLTVLILVASVQLFAQNTPGMQRLPNGLQYKIFTQSPGPKIKANDIITFDFIQKTDKDSVLVSSFEAKRPATIQVQPAQNVADLMDFFPLLSLNDSAIVSIPTDSIFTSPEMQRPPFMPIGSNLFITVKINKIQSMEAAMAEQQQQMDAMKSTEQAGLAKYISDNKINALATGSGLRYLITKPSAKPKPAKGDTVFVNYIGRTLAGKVFDSSIETEAKKAALQQPGRNYEPISVVLGEGNVIPGWEEGLALMNEGSKATLIIPSELAYGPQGASEDIKPFSTLVFDLELVQVKRVKSATPATKSVAPAVKKPAPKTSAVKPAVKSGTTKTPIKK